MTVSAEKLHKLCKRITCLTQENMHNDARLAVCRAIPELNPVFMAFYKAKKQFDLATSGYCSHYMNRRDVDDDMHDALNRVQPDLGDKIWRCL